MHQAFRPGSRLQFHHTDNPHVLCYSRESADGRDRIMVVLSLDPKLMQHGWVDVPVDAWDLPRDYAVLDELSGETFRWTGPRNYVRLEPGVSPGHILVFPPGEGA